MDLSSFVDAQFALPFLTATFHAILFLQSGIDKIVDKAGNMEWLRGHFKNSPLGPFLPMLFATLTAMEMVSGLLCAFGACVLLSGGSPYWSLLGMISCGLTFVALFFGQRLAKDYAGAA